MAQYLIQRALCTMSVLGSLRAIDNCIDKFNTPFVFTVLSSLTMQVKKPGCYCI